MVEADSQAILKRSIEVYYPSGIYHKIVDVIGNKKPFDCWFISGGEFVAIETKICKNERFSFSQVKDHQIKALVRVKNNEFAAYVGIHWYRPRKLSVFTFIEIGDFLHLTRIHPMKSIKLKELVEENYCQSVCLVNKEPNDKGRMVDYINLSESYL